MKKLLIFLALFIFLGILFYGIAYFRATTSFGALKVKTNIKSKVYLDNNFLGATPLCKGDHNCDDKEGIKTGEYFLKIVPEDSSFIPFSVKIPIHKDVLTVVERMFLPSSMSHAFVLTLERISPRQPQMLLTSLPSGALAFIDGNLVGNTPLLLEKLETKEHEVQIQKYGFAKKTLKVNARPFYKLVVFGILGTQPPIETIPLAAPATVATQSGSIKITKTPTGFLRVRQEPSLSSREITKVYPEEVYPYLEERQGWLKIQLKDSATGWILETYAEKL